MLPLHAVVACCSCCLLLLYAVVVLLLHAVVACCCSSGWHSLRCTGSRRQGQIGGDGLHASILDEPGRAPLVLLEGRVSLHGGVGGGHELALRELVAHVDVCGLGQNFELLRRGLRSAGTSALPAARGGAGGAVEGLDRGCGLLREHAGASLRSEHALERGLHHGDAVGHLRERGLGPLDALHRIL